MNPHYFSSDNQQLFGMYHRARGGGQKSTKAVVICSPIGQEYVRTHWCLRLLAGQLARRGVHVLRFDYAGQGDSSARFDEIQSLEQWQNDVNAAGEFLMDESGASSVMLLGLRTGAALATQLAGTSDDINSLLLWEPIHRGESYLMDLRGLHSAMLDMWICKMETENSDTAEEILGSRFDRLLIDDLKQAEIDWDQIQVPHYVFDTQCNQADYQLDANPMRKVEFTLDESSWLDLKQLETAWLRPQTTRRIVDQVVDTFERLQKFGVLDSGVGAQTS